MFIGSMGLVYLPTCTIKINENVGNYRRPNYTIHGILRDS